MESVQIRGWPGSSPPQCVNAGSPLQWSWWPCRPSAPFPLPLTLAKEGWDPLGYASSSSFSLRPPLLFSVWILGPGWCLVTEAHHLPIPLCKMACNDQTEAAWGGEGKRMNSNSIWMMRKERFIVEGRSERMAQPTHLLHQPQMEL